MPKLKKAFKACAAGSLLGKNAGPMTKAAAMAYM
jgi:hypothetical protein